MARVSYGSGVTEYKGSIGGITYQQNASGYIAKLRSKPTVNPTAAQATYQNRMSMLVAYWSGLTSVQQAGWDTFAAAHDHTTPWGDVKTLSGYQWFLSCNLRRMMYHSTPLAAAPAWTAQSVPDAFTIEVSATYIRAAWSPAYDAPTDMIAYISLPLRQSSLKMRRSLFWIENSINPAALNNWNLTIAVAALYNVTWSTFYGSAKCNIIMRILQGDFATGLFSSFTSAIVKVT